VSTVIKVENISKQYRLGEVGTGALAHDVNKWWHKVRGKENPYLKIGETNDRTVKGESDYVWALKDINFEVKQGEVLGIIGRNGAGKSTLLKILSKTTTPTTGSIKIKGRIASLLEVGTGFHPELSGRENIFLNGAILGMTKREIKSKFDEIVDFAGVERYIDTPVKRYSSGMYVRLAFGVAAHLEPEILIVDEVLAVGDAEFQKKALGKMKEVSVEGGRTVLFVSHNMAAINKLCNTGLLMSKGNIEYIGNVRDTVDKYINLGNSSLGEINFKGNSNIYASVIKIKIQNEKGEVTSELSVGEK
jgi:lipopolysaccharide transport system ATP-binding protein